MADPKHPKKFSEEFERAKAGDWDVVLTPAR
jgi:hypothetical protein